MKVADKVIVVTGGGNGLGREIVLELLKKGSKVAALDISEKGLNETKELAKAYSENLSIHTIDITNKVEIEKLPNLIIEKHGVIDGVINNAGIIQPFVTVNELNYETINRVMNVNFYGTLFLTKALLPILLKRPEAHIANVSSMGGFFPFPGQTIYGASKAAVKLLTEGLIVELIDTNIKVSSVLPGSIGTNITKNSGVKMNSEMEQMQGKAKVLSPNKAAQIIIKGIEKNKSKILVGTDAKIMDFMYKIFPFFAPRMVAKFVGKKLLGK